MASILLGLIPIGEIGSLAIYEHRMMAGLLKGTLSAYLRRGTLPMVVPATLALDNEPVARRRLNGRRSAREHGGAQNVGLLSLPALQL
jgi:hypothetical protein